MSEPKGWCPTLFAPMPSGDGMLVRVRPPGGVLRAEAARRLAAAATQYGSGVIELTNRASLQPRGLRPDTVAPFAAAMVEAGLACANPAMERRRVVIAPPLAGDDPAADPRAPAIVAALEAMLMREAMLSALPAKFGVLVDAGGVLPTASAPADIRVTLRGDALIVLDGATLAVACQPDDVPGIVLRLATACIAFAAGRMRALVAGIGAEAVFAAAGLTATASVTAAPAPDALGWLPYADGPRGAFGLGVPFGSTDAATLHAIADAAEHFGDGTLRLTPWRAFAVPRVTAPGALRESLAPHDVIAAAGDARARMSVCPGAPACASATVPTRADAAAIAALHPPGHIHLSGCAKGCAHPAPADLTLVGHAGRYAIIRHGRAGDPPMRTGLTLADILHTLRGTTA